MRSRSDYKVGQGNSPYAPEVLRPLKFVLRLRQSNSKRFSLYALKKAAGDRGWSIPSWFGANLPGPAQKSALNDPNRGE